MVVKGRITHSAISDVDQESVVYRSGVEFIEPSERVRQIELAYRLALGRAPSERERTIAEQYLASGHEFEGLAHVLLNTNEFAYLR